MYVTGNSATCASCQHHSFSSTSVAKLHVDRVQSLNGPCSHEFGIGYTAATEDCYGRLRGQLYIGSNSAICASCQHRSGTSAEKLYVEHVQCFNGPYCSHEFGIGYTATAEDCCSRMMGQRYSVYGRQQCYLC